MTIFVDAPAMISMMAGESDADELADRFGDERLRLCSAVSVWETVAGLCRTYVFSVPSARAEVQSFVELSDLKFVSIGEREFELATQAYADFGKGRHPAALNMGDCFAYACAKANRATLLFKGDDFTKTDIARAR
jgi:ribonuclease VapC